MKKVKKPAPPAIVEHEHGRYLIKAGTLQGRVIARAFPKPPSRFRHLVAEASGDTPEDAIEQLIGKLDQLRSERRSLRRTDADMTTGVPTSEEYADALRSLSPGPKLLGVLHDHALCGRRGMQLAELAKAAGYASVQDLLKAYEKFGREILGVIEPDEVLATGLPVIMPEPGEAGRKKSGLESLQPELQDAMLRLLGSARRTA